MQFERKIGRALSWMRAATLAEGIAAGSLAAAAGALAVVLARKWVVGDVWLPGVAFFMVMAMAGGVAGVWRRRRPTEGRAALALDERFGLEERFVTALQARRSAGGATGFLGAVVADAEARAADVRPRVAADWRGGRFAGGAVFVAVLATAGHFFLPEADLLGRKASRASAAAQTAAVVREANTLKELEKRLAPPPAPDGPTASEKRTAADVAELRRQFAAGVAPTARDAMAKVSNLAEKLDAEREALKAKAETPVGPDGAQAPADLTEKSKGAAAELERALRRGDTERAAAELDRLGEQAAAPGRDAGENKALGVALEGLADRIAGQPGLTEGLSEAGKALSAATGSKPAGEAAAAKAGFDKAKAALAGVASAQAEMRRLDRALSDLEAAKGRLADAANGAGTQGPAPEKAGGDKGEGEGLQADASGAKGEGKAGEPGKSAEGGNSPAEGQQGGSPEQGGEASDQAGAGSSETSGTRTASGGARPSPSQPGGQTGDKQPGGPEGAGKQSAEGSGSQSDPAGKPGDGQSGDGKPSDGASQSADGTKPAGDSGSGAGGDKFEVGSGSGSPPPSQSPGQGGEGAGQQGGQQADAAGQGAQAGRSGSSPDESGQSGQPGQSGQSGQSSQSGGASASASASSSSGSSGGTAQSGGKGQGQGGGEPDYCVGTTNLDETGANPKPAAARAQTAGRQSDRKAAAWTEQFVKLYDPRVTETKGSVERAKAALGQGQFQGSIDVEGKARRESAKTATTKAFLDYREAQKDSLAKDDIPMGYKEYVKGYFDSIEPPK